MAWSRDLEERLAVAEGHLFGVSAVLNCLIAEMNPSQRAKMAAAVALAFEEIEASLLAQAEPSIENNIKGLHYARRQFIDEGAGEDGRA